MVDQLVDGAGLCCEAPHCPRLYNDRLGPEHCLLGFGFTCVSEKVWEVLEDIAYPSPTGNTIVDTRTYGPKGSHVAKLSTDRLCTVK